MRSSAGPEGARHIPFAIWERAGAKSSGPFFVPAPSFLVPRRRPGSSSAGVGDAPTSPGSGLRRDTDMGKNGTSPFSCLASCPPAEAGAQQRGRGRRSNTVWIPACAGMTGVGGTFERKLQTFFVRALFGRPNQSNRHASGGWRSLLSSVAESEIPASAGMTGMAEWGGTGWGPDRYGPDMVSLRSTKG
jgi:hypothetical protein